MGAKPTDGRHQPNVTRRFYLFGAFIFALAFVEYVAAGLPLELPMHDAPLGIALTLAVAAQHYWIVNGRVTFRRGHESFDGLTITFAAFFLSPAWLVVVAAGGPQIAWLFQADHTPRMRWLNGSGTALAGVSCAAMFAWIAPNGPLDSPEALLAAFGMWGTTEVVRFGMVVVFVRARFASWRSPFLIGRLRGIPGRAAPVMFGYLAAVAVAGAPWMVPVVASAIALMYVLLKYSSRLSGLESIMSWFLAFFGRIDQAEAPEVVEEALTGAFQQFAVLTSYGVATVGDDGHISWTGDVAAHVCDGLRSRDDLDAFSQTAPTPNPFWTGTLWVWPLDQIRRSYMVVTGKMRSCGIADVTMTGGYLVESSRLAIETMRRRRTFAASAAAEHLRARTDALTELPNQLGFVEQVDAVMRSRPDDRLTVLQASLVGFQHTVDVLGAATGDELLVKFADRLKRTADAVPTIAVIGRGADDTFLVGVVGDIDIDTVSGLISEPGVDRTGSAMSRDVWVGVADNAAAGSIDASELVQRAHLAMGRAELESKPITFGRDDIERERRRVSVRFRLPRAIESGAVQPAFQPQIDLTTQQVVACEVLARWVDPQIGAVTPVEFVEISEQSQQIELLTLSLLRQALDLNLADSSGRRVPLSLNLSARSLANDGFVEALAATITEAGRPIEEFTFEIAESTVARDGISAIFGIEHLRTLGARVSIDDFGTGNSTLSYLDTLPVDEIKIDRMLTSAIGTLETPNPVIRHLVGLCDDLGLEVVAEGIENGLQRDLAREFGCRRAQGYLFARPLAPAEALKWVSSNTLSPDAPLAITC